MNATTTTNTQPNPTDANQELIAIARKIRQWQLDREITDAEICRRFAGLGSTKTYRLIEAGKTEDLDVDRWLQEYQQVWNLVEIESSKAELDEPDYDDLSYLKRARCAVTDAMNEHGNNRLVIIEGPSGTGKTTIARTLAARFGCKIAMAEVDETWKQSISTMLGGILRAIGCRELPLSADLRRERLISQLRDNPRCLVLDEAHHLGPTTLNLVKTILNQTQSQVIFLCIPVLMKRIELAAYEEALQLTRNRLCERVRLGQPTAKDVVTFLSRRLNWEDQKTLEDCAASLSQRSIQHGYWNFINLVSRNCRRIAKASPVSREMLGKALEQAVSTR